MSVKYKFREPDGCYFVTFAVVGWADVFTRNIYKEILIESWKHCQQYKGLNIHAYVIMTNHVHMIISRNSDALLQAIMRDMKKYTSTIIINAIKANKQESRKEWIISLLRNAGEENSNNKIFQFWQQDNHPVLCDTTDMLKQKMKYVHENPVRAGFVEKAEDWIYSSAGDYYLNRKGLIDISFV
jgi:REP element-mobilizing transposase RayT